MSVAHFGDFDTTETVNIPFNTFSSDDPSASVTITNLVAADVKLHKDGSLTQRSSAAGVTVSIDYDGITGNHLVAIDLSDNTDAGFYSAGSRYQIRMEGTTVDGGTINAWIGSYSIGCVLRPSVDGRTLGVESDGDLTKVNTLNGHTPQTGDTFPLIGTPADLGDGDTVAGNFTALAGKTSEAGSYSRATDSQEAIRDRGDAAWTTGGGGSSNPQVLVNTTISSVTSQTVLGLSSGSPSNDSYNGCVVVIEDSVDSTLKCVGVVDDYNGATLELTLLNDPGIFTIAIGDTVDILADRSLKPSADNRTISVESDGDLTKVNTLNGHTAQTGDTFPLIGTPSNETVSNDIADVLTEVNANETKIDTLLTRITEPLFTGITSLANWLRLGLRSDAAIEDDAYIELAEINANVGSGSGDYFAQTDANEAIRDRGDAAWTTGGGGSSNPQVLVNTTISSVTSQTVLGLSSGSPSNDSYNGCVVVIEDSVDSTLKCVGVVDDYNGATLELTLLNDPGIFTIAIGDTVDILADRSLKPSADNRTISVETDGDLTKVNTLNGHTPQTGDSYLTVNTNLDATVSSRGTANPGNQMDLVNAPNATAITAIQSGLATETKQDIIDSNVDTLLTRITASLFTGITSLAEWLGLIAGSQTADATAKTEIQATGAGSGTYDESTDSQEAIAGAGGGGAPTVDQIADAVWNEAISGHTTSTTFGGKNQKVVPSETVADYKADVSNLDATVSSRSSHSAADVWAVGTRTLTSFGTLVADIWAVATSGLTTVGSIGKLLVDNINATISSRSSFDSTSDSVTVGTNNDKTGYTASSVTDKTGYSISGTIQTLDALDTAQDAQHAQTQTDIGNLNDISVSDILQTQMTEGYASNGTAPTLEQALFLIQQSIGDFSVSGTTITAKKIDGAATAATYTTDSATDPTSRTRST